MKEIKANIHPFMLERVCTGLTILAMTLAGCATMPATSSEPLLGALEVDEVAVESSAGGDLSAAEREWFRELLGNQATARARRAVFEQRLAGVVGRAPAGAGESYRLVGQVSLPVALPSEVRGSRAAFTKGNLATARVELLDGRGRLVATAESFVDWGEVRWTTGGPKMRRAKDPDLALVDAAELAIDRAVKDLIDDMTSRAANPKPSAGQIH